MTGYTVHTGSSIKFSSGWDRIFSGTKAPAKSVAAMPSKPKKGVKKKAAAKVVKKTGKASKKKVASSAAPKKKVAKKATKKSK